MDTMNTTSAPILNSPQAEVVNAKVTLAQSNAASGAVNTSASSQFLATGVQLLGDAVMELGGILQHTPR
jgi:hypothetical protein